MSFLDSELSPSCNSHYYNAQIRIRLAGTNLYWTLVNDTLGAKVGFDILVHTGR